MTQFNQKADRALRGALSLPGVNAGAPMPEIRDLLGHSYVSMTEKYAHLAPENVRVAVGTLEDASRSGHAPSELPEKAGK